MSTRSRDDEAVLPAFVNLPGGDRGAFDFAASLPSNARAETVGEFAVAIDDLAVDPGYLAEVRPSTMTIALDPHDVAVEPEVPLEEVPPIPDLPEADRVRPRRTFRIEPKPRQRDFAVAGSSSGRSSDGRKPAPEGLLQSLLYWATFRLVNVGDSLRVRQSKELDARIGKLVDGGTRFVAVLARQGGVGQTTVGALLGMAMADARDDLILVIDANPDRGTLAERVTQQTRATVRDVVTRASAVHEFEEFQSLISRDQTGLDVLASDADPMASEAFDENGYNVVADVAERFYSVAITDCGTGVVHSAVRATLLRADAVVIVSGGSVDEARLASEMLTWLESNGHEELARNSILALNTATHGTNLAKLDDIESHFRPRVRDIVRMPYDPSLAGGSLIRFAELQPVTRDSARDLAALVVDGLPEQRVI